VESPRVDREPAGLWGNARWPPTSRRCGGAQLRTRIRRSGVSDTPLTVSTNLGIASRAPNDHALALPMVVIPTELKRRSHLGWSAPSDHRVLGGFAAVRAERPAERRPANGRSLRSEGRMAEYALPGGLKAERGLTPKVGSVRLTLRRPSATPDTRKTPRGAGPGGHFAVRWVPLGGSPRHHRPTPPNLEAFCECRRGCAELFGADHR